MEGVEITGVTRQCSNKPMKTRFQVEISFGEMNEQQTWFVRPLKCSGSFKCQLSMCSIRFLVHFSGLISLDERGFFLVAGGCVSAKSVSP